MVSAPWVAGGGGFARRGQQSLNELPGLARIQSNLLALIDDITGHLADMGNDKFGHRAAPNCGRLLEKLFVRLGHPGDKSLAFSLFPHRRHTQNVCQTGIPRKNWFSFARTG